MLKQSPLFAKSDLLTLTSGIEFAIRTAMRRERYWHSTGATEEDEHKDGGSCMAKCVYRWSISILARRTSLETEALVAMFREEGLWDSEASDEA